MTLPENNYPVQYHTDFELKTVVDSLYSKVTSIIVPFDPANSSTYDWENGLGQIDLDNTTLWSNSGYVTVYLENNYGNAIDRACLFHYASKNDTSLLNVTILPGQKIVYFPENSNAIQNIVAENHNYNRNAIMQLEQYLGYRGTQDQSTVEWFTNFYVHNVRVPKPWVSVYPTILFVGEYAIIQDMTTRIRPGFTPLLDSSVKWIFNLTDVRIEVSLDIETQEYVFNYTFYDQNNDLVIKEERKKEWNKEIRFRFTKSGKKNLTLFVQNEFGSDTLILNNLITVIDEVPEEANITVYSNTATSSNAQSVRARAIVDQITVTANLDNRNDVEIAENGYIWDIPNVDPDLIPHSAYLNLSFDVGGNYDIGLKIVTSDEGWIGAFLLNAIDIVEKPSVWLGYASIFSGKFNLYEYAMRANVWKASSADYNLNYDFGDIEQDTIYKISFRDSNGFFAAPDSDDAYLFWAPNKRALDIAKFNTMTDTIVPELPNTFIKLYDWFTLYIPEFDSNRMYILGGLSDLSDLSKMNQDIIYYDISSRSFVTVIQDFILPQSGNLRKLPNGLFLTPDNQVVNSKGEILVFDISNIDTSNLESVQSYTVAFSNAQEMISNPNSAVVKWKSTSFSGKGYMLRNSKSNFLEDFFSFDPAQNVFQTIQSNVPFNKYELAFEALNDAIYVVSNKGDLFKYHPDTNVWNSTTTASSEAFIAAFHTEKQSSRDENARVIAGAESKTINASNTNLFFSYDYSFDAFGKFDTQTFSFQKLAQRPTYDSEASTQQWGLGVF